MSGSNRYRSWARLSGKGSRRSGRRAARPAARRAARRVPGRWRTALEAGRLGRLTSRLTRGTAAGTLAVTGLAALALGPAGLALTVSEQALAEPEPEVPEHLPGMEVRDGPAVFVVHELRCGADQGAVNGRLCVATVDARNVGSEPLAIPGSGQLLHSPDGVRHLPASDDPTPFGMLERGERATAVIEYDVPEHVEITHVEVRADPYSRGQAVSLAGPPLPLLD